MAELDFNQRVSSKPLMFIMLLLAFMIFFIMTFHYLLALNSSSNYLMVVEKLEESLE
jgi:hypothetical protein